MCFEAQRLETGNDELHGGKSHLTCTKLRREGLLLKDRQRCAGRGWSEGRAGMGMGMGGFGCVMMWYLEYGWLVVVSPLASAAFEGFER